MKTFTLAIIGYGETGKAALRHMLQRVNDGDIDLREIVICDIRPMDIDVESIKLHMHVTVGREIPVTVQTALPHNFDIYWICIPCRRNIHDLAHDVKPLNKLTTGIMQVYHSESIIINSTIVPVGRNNKMYDKITMKAPENTSWVYAPIVRGTFTIAGVAKMSNRRKESVANMNQWFWFEFTDITTLEYVALELRIRAAAMAQIEAELSSAAMTFKEIEPLKLRQVRNALGQIEYPHGYAENDFTAGQILLHDLKPKEISGCDWLPMLSNISASAKFRVGHVVDCIIEAAHAQKPDNMNQSYIYIYGTGEWINQVTDRLHRSTRMPDHAMLYQARSPSIHGPDVPPEIRTITIIEAKSRPVGLHILMDESARDHTMVYNMEYV